MRSIGGKRRLLKICLKRGVWLRSMQDQLHITRLEERFGSQALRKAARWAATEEDQSIPCAECLSCLRPNDFHHPGIEPESVMYREKIERFPRKTTWGASLVMRGGRSLPSK